MECKKQQNLDSITQAAGTRDVKIKLKCGSGVAIGAQRRNLGAICQPPNLNTKCQHMLELTKCPHDISYHSFFLHNLHIYKWYTDNFLKRRLHPSSSSVYYHILQSKTIFHFFFFSFLPFRGLATKCGSAMLKPKGVSDCVPKYQR